MASILETFYILFESNTDKLKTGTDEAKRSSKGLEDQLGETDRAGQQMGENLISTLKGVALAFAGAFAIDKIKDVIGETAALNAQLGLAADRLDIPVADLYALGQAAEETGGDLNGVLGTLDALNRGMADIATKGTSRLKPFFDEMGITVTDAQGKVRPLIDLLGDVSEKMETMTKQERSGIGEKLGMDAGTIMLLGKGRKGMDELIAKIKEQGTVTEKDTEIAHKFMRSMDEMEDQVYLFATAIGSAVLPALTKFFALVGEGLAYLQNHKGLVIGFFAGIAGVITALYLPAILQAVAATIAFLAPWLLIIGVIAGVGLAIGLLVDDVQNFLAGNKSVIGALAEMWPAFGDGVRATVKGIGDAFIWFVDVLGTGFSLTTAVLGAFWRLGVAVFNGLKDAAGGFAVAFPTMTLMAQTFGNVIAWVAKMVAGLVGWLAKIGVGVLGALPKMFQAGADLLNSTNKGTDGKPGAKAPGGQQGAGAGGAAQGGPANQPPPETAKAVQAGKQTMATADASPYSSNSSTAITNNAAPRTVQKNTTVNAPVTVNAAPGMSADDVGKAVAKHLQTEIEQTVNHFDDGVQK